MAMNGQFVITDMMIQFPLVLICSICSSCQSMKAPELKEKLHESEKLIQEMTVTWEEKLRKTEEIATVCALVK